MTQPTNPSLKIDFNEEIGFFILIRTYEKPKVEAKFVGWVETQHMFRAVNAGLDPAYKSLTKIDFNEEIGFFVSPDSVNSIRLIVEHH